MIGQDDDRALGILEIGKCGGCLILSIESVGKECQIGAGSKRGQSALLRATSCQSSRIAILIIVISTCGRQVLLSPMPDERCGVSSANPTERPAGHRSH
jgi:hypothetical protein